jgi:hypothetical protein
MKLQCAEEVVWVFRNEQTMGRLVMETAHFFFGYNLHE